MTSAALNYADPVTISGVGPYNIPHEYSAGGIIAFAVGESGQPVQLEVENFTLEPESSELTGSLYLSASAAGLYDGETLYIRRQTGIVQDWSAVNSASEASLAVQLDYLARGLQEVQERSGRSVVVFDGRVNEVVPEPGHVLMWGDPGDRLVSGPRANQVADAQHNAEAAAQSLVDVSAFFGLRYDDIAALKAAPSLPVGTEVRVGPVLEAGQSLRIFPNGTYVANENTVFDLPGSGMQAVSMRKVFADVVEVLADTRGAAEFDAGDILSTLDGNAYTVVASGGDLTTAGSVQVAYNARAETIPLSALGGGASKTGAENTAAIETAWNNLKSGGGTIVLDGPGKWLFDNSSFDPTASFRDPVTIAAVPGAIVYPNTPLTGVFMWDFNPSGSAVMGVEFENIEVNGQVTPGNPASARENCSGIRVTRANRLRALNCRGRYIDGTAWHFRRMDNAVIDVVTYRCGKSDGSAFACMITGSTALDEPTNDVRLSGTSEQDFYGWLIEGSTIVKTSSQIKLHGGDDAYRALQIHKCADVDIEVKTTLGYNLNGFIHISDADGGDGITAVEDFVSVSNPTRVRLNLTNHFNNEVLGDGVTLDLVTVDCGTASSYVELFGALKPQVAPSGAGSDYRQVGLSAPGNSGARITLSGLVATDADYSKFIDDRRTATTKLTVPRASNIALPVEDTRKSTAGSSRVEGEVVNISYAGAGAVPPQNMSGFVPTAASQGLAFGMPQHVIGGQFLGTISAAQRLVVGQRPLVAEDAIGGQSSAVLSRVIIGAGGVAGTYDAANHWVLDIYRSTTVVESVILSRGTTTSVAGDLFPNTVAGAAATTGYVMDYWDGLNNFVYGKGNFLAAALRPVGAPPNLTDCQVQLFFDLVI